MLDRFRISSRPRPQSDAVVHGDRWRITVLTDGLLRLEWSDDGAFEDRASTFAWHREQPVPTFEVHNGDDQLELLTDRLHLSYDRGPFSTSGLSVQVRGRVSHHRATWRFGTEPHTLGGTARTLDDVDGRLPLEPGVISRDGIAVIDDSTSFLFTDDGGIGTREPGRVDLYVFAYGHDYPAALRAFYAVSGPPPVLPRWALGTWWSRYHAYSDVEYLALLDRFEAEDVPLSVGVLDMDWHRVESVPERYGTGWTGYSWEPTLFPDPEGFLARLHERGLRVTLNVHPHEGVRPFEDAYVAMCAAVGRDPADDLAVPFDLTDPVFARAYFDVLHHELEEQGVDFWWLDWQQGTHSRVPGVDPLWLLNHLHFLDSGRDDHRPLTFSRYAGPGSHRYPIGFSGDTVVSWASLDFQPEFTATAANIGYGWWSHDIGGHLAGERDDELALRWFQLGTFSPINRLHSSSNPFLVKEPWLYPPGVRAAMGATLRLRHRLVPYLHTMNYRAATGAPLVTPMYHGHPRADAAYEVPNQFAFGDSLIVTPITRPADPVTRLGSSRAWLPRGLWADLFTGTVYDARDSANGRVVRLHRDETSIPVLLAAGAVLPLAAEHERDAAANPEHLELMLLPGASGERELVEDDGTGSTPETIPTTRTPLVWDDETGELRIGPAAGPRSGVPERRSWTLTLLGVGDVGAVRGTDASPAEVERMADRIRLTVRDVPTDQTLVLRLPDLPAPTTPNVPGRVFDLVNAAQWGHEEKAAVWAALGDETVEVSARLAALDALDVPSSLASAVTELLAAR